MTPTTSDQAASTNNCIWIIEDEKRIADVLCAYLEQAGFNTRYFSDGDRLIESIKQTAPALILLDIMLPGKDGFSLCREIRQFFTIPVILITARIEEFDRLLGLELGADDYICKPFSPREVVARVKTVLRRTQSTAQQEAVLTPETNPFEPSLIISAGDFTINSDNFNASVGGTILELTPKEFSLLKAFVSRPGRVYTREQLMKVIYDEAEIVSDRMIDSHIKNLRKKISSVSPAREFIHAIYGVGYKFIP